MIKDLEKFGTLNILNASSFKKEIFHIKSAYRCTTIRQQSVMEETVKGLEDN